MEEERCTRGGREELGGPLGRVESMFCLVDFKLTSLEDKSVYNFKRNRFSCPKVYCLYVAKPIFDVKLVAASLTGLSDTQSLSCYGEL